MQILDNNLHFKSKNKGMKPNQLSNDFLHSVSKDWDLIIVGYQPIQCKEINLNEMIDMLYNASMGCCGISAR